MRTNIFVIGVEVGVGESYGGGKRVKPCIPLFDFVATIIKIFLHLTNLFLLNRGQTVISILCLNLPYLNTGPIAPSIFTLPKLYPKLYPRIYLKLMINPTKTDSTLNLLCTLNLNSTTNHFIVK